MANVNQQQLDGLGARFDKGFDELKSLLRSFDDRIRAVELREASCSPRMEARLSSAEQMIESQKNEIKELRDMIEKQSDTADKITNAIDAINGWGRWAAKIATALIISGLLFFIGRLIYLSITGTPQ